MKMSVMFSSLNQNLKLPTPTPTPFGAAVIGHIDEVGYDKLYILYDGQDALNESEIPDPSDYTVNVYPADVVNTVLTVDVINFSVVLTLTTPAEFEETIYVSYTAGSTPLINLHNTQCDDFAFKSVLNLVPEPIPVPVYHSSMIGVPFDTWVSVAFNGVLETGQLPDKAAFTISGLTIQSIAFDGNNKLRIVTNESGVSGSNYFLSYI